MWFAFLTAWMGLHIYVCMVTMYGRKQESAISVDSLKIILPCVLLEADVRNVRRRISVVF